jgi:hypothetical protein
LDFLKFWDFQLPIFRLFYHTLTLNIIYLAADNSSSVPSSPGGGGQESSFPLLLLPNSRLLSGAGVGGGQQQQVVSMHDLLLRLPQCINRELIDSAAVAFLVHLSDKKAHRKRLAQHFVVRLFFIVFCWSQIFIFIVFLIVFPINLTHRASF